MLNPAWRTRTLCFLAAMALWALPAAGEIPQGAAFRQSMLTRGAATAELPDRPLSFEQAVALLRELREQYRHDILLLTRVREAQDELSALNRLRESDGKPPLTLSGELCGRTVPLRPYCALFTATFGPPREGLPGWPAGAGARPEEEGGKRGVR